MRHYSNKSTESSDKLPVFAGVLLTAGLHSALLAPIVTEINTKVEEVIEEELPESDRSQMLREQFYSVVSNANTESPEFLQQINWFEFYLLEDYAYSQTVTQDHIDLARTRFNNLIERLEPQRSNLFSLGQEISDLFSRTNYHPQVVEMTSLLVDIRGFDNFAEQESYLGGCQAYAKLLIALLSALRPDLEIRLLFTNYSFQNVHVEVVFQHQYTWYKLGDNGFEPIDVDESNLVTLGDNFESIYSASDESEQPDNQGSVRPLVLNSVQNQGRNSFQIPNIIHTLPTVEIFPTEQPVPRDWDPYIQVYLPEGDNWLFSAGTLSQLQNNTPYSFVRCDNGSAFYCGYIETDEDRQNRLEQEFRTFGLNTVSRHNLLSELEFISFLRIDIEETNSRPQEPYILEVPHQITKLDEIINLIQERRLYVHLKLEYTHSEVSLSGLDPDLIVDIRCSLKSLSELNRLNWNFQGTPFLSKITTIDLDLSYADPNSLNQFLGLLVNFPRLRNLVYTNAPDNLYLQIIQNEILDYLYRRGLTIWGL